MARRDPRSSLLGNLFHKEEKPVSKPPPEIKPPTEVKAPIPSGLQVCKSDLVISGYNVGWVHPSKLTSASAFFLLRHQEHSLVLKVETSPEISPTQIALGKTKRDFLTVAEGDYVDYTLTSPPSELKETVFELSWHRKSPVKISEEELEHQLRALLHNTVLTKDLVIPVPDVRGGPNNVLRYRPIDLGASGLSVGLVTPETKIILTGDPVRPTRLLKVNNLSFETTGVGSVDAEFEEIFRRSFLTRTIPERVYQKLGIKHTKGILLYGPPGCGKTCIARSLAQMVNCKPPKIINGPEVLNKYVGQSEENIRELFREAEEDPHNTYMIIFDEFDAIAMERGDSGAGSKVNDSLVKQLLSKIDGVQALNNIILVGLTNRIDLIDKAILRPGRFEVQIEIGLPNREGRVQILKIHTKALTQNHILAPDVDLELLAEHTENMTGAELESVVKEATTLSLRRHVDPNKLSEVAKDLDNLVVTMEDFQESLTHVHPMFGNHQEKLQDILGVPYERKSSGYEGLTNNLLGKIGTFRVQERPGIFRILIEGASGCGKTYLSAYLAQQLKFKFIRYIGANELMSYSESEKSSRLGKIFNDALRAQESLVIIDDIDILVEWTPPHHFSNRMVQTIKTLLGTLVTEGKLVVILNTTSYEDLKEKNLFSRIDEVVGLGKEKEDFGVEETGSL